MASFTPEDLAQELDEVSLSSETSGMQEEEVVFKGRAGGRFQTLNASAPCFTPQHVELFDETAGSRQDVSSVQPSSGGDQLQSPRRYSRRTVHASPAQPKLVDQYSSPPPPRPSAFYIKLASETPVRLSEARRLLVVLDLNGTLLHRERARHNARFTLRSNAEWFLDYLFRHHKVMVWSSATPRSVEAICGKIFNDEQRKELLAIWTRVNFDLTKRQYKEKVQVYKQLSKIWTHPKLRRGHPIQDESWTQENTVLIDDSREKAVSEPYNHIEVDEFVGPARQKAQSTLEQVKEYLEVLKWQKNVSAYIRRHPLVYKLPG
ncbi:hypothetical protein M433DRAFT_150750 [Acidomyces richmondensis BFW]|nr:MAG: hypothetical protein FE78DRAFT_84763 [Acidomyces sp. 'richmondensis']KYG48726.1 hypothetical protein M433DRAFT_150750 [Acidomyces richmondensis BFW]